MPTPLSPAMRRAVFTPILLVIGVLALEGVARLFLREGAMATIPSESVRAHITLGGDIVYDPILGWKRSKLPNDSLGLDSNGFRHPEVSKAKKPGVVRGFALGDSQTYGAGVAPKEAWPTVAEAKLGQAGHRVELINAGLSGYNSRQALRLIEVQLLAFDPDFLVIDCQRADGVRDDRPPQQDGLRPALERALFYSRLYRGLRLGIDQLTARLNPGSKSNLMLPQFSVPSPLPRTATPGNHDLIADLALSKGIKAFFLDYPFGTTPPSALYAGEGLPPSAQLIHSVPALIATGRPTAALFLDNNHLTAAGNLVVGEAVAQAVGAWLSDGAASTP